jgi:hypothetical protein
MSAKKKNEGERNISIGGIEGNRGTINISTGDAIHTHIEQTFSPVYTAIAVRPNTSEVEKSDLKDEVADVETAIKEPKVDENFVVRRLRNIGRMAPDILEVALAALVSPAAGLGKAAEKIAAKAREK